MDWYEKLYLGEGVKSKWKKIQKKVCNRKLCVDVYLITKASNPTELLDIIPSFVLLQKTYPVDDLQIIGMAHGKQEAITVVQQVLEETYEATGAFDVFSYLHTKGTFGRVKNSKW